LVEPDHRRVPLLYPGPTHLDTRRPNVNYAALELALARVNAGQIDGAQEALAPLLTLEPQRRIGGIVTSAGRVHHALRARRYAASPVARDLREEIEAFCRVPAAALPA
jgi:hypothetical protein